MSSHNPSRKQSPPYSALRAFEAVGRLGGIRRAALDLGLDHAVVSRHLRALEDWAGLPLVNRQREGRVLTDAGARYHQRISGALEEIARASTELVSSRDNELLRIWSSPGFASEWLTARLPLFQSMHPGIEIELRPTDASPDFTRYEAEVDIRYVYGDLMVKPAIVSGGSRRVELARPAVFPVASPKVAQAIPPPKDVADLLRAPLLHEETKDYWRAWFTANGITCPEHLAGPLLWQAHLTIEAARRGQGVALANRFLLGDDLETGRLVEVIDRKAVANVSLGAYVFAARADKWQSTAIAGLRKWLRSQTAEPFTPPPLLASAATCAVPR
jgi:DNA-binding transcriptional LysR family regulator